jgi:hypothetical protein
VGKKEKKKKSTLNSVGYVIGSLAVGAVASIVVPKFINKGASFIYKKTNKRDVSFNDTKDVIVKKQSK